MFVVARMLRDNGTHVGNRQVAQLAKCKDNVLLGNTQFKKGALEQSSVCSK